MTTTATSYREYAELPAFEDAVWNGDKVANAPGAIKWSGGAPPPAIGARIIVTINNCGPAIVTGYFVEHGWLGVLCRLLDAPEWHRRQNHGNPLGHAFGAEIKAAE